MKKFIFTIPIQKPEFSKNVNYLSDFDSLKNDLVTKFPILIPIVNSVKESEHIKIIAICINHENTKVHMPVFQEELDNIAKNIGFSYEIEFIHTEFNESLNSHISLYLDLIEFFSDNDILTADVTYGTKPTPMIIKMALSFAKNYYNNVFIDKIIYASLNFITGESKVHDVSSLFYMERVTQLAKNHNLEDIKKILKNIADEGEDSDE